MLLLQLDLIKALQIRIILDVNYPACAREGIPPSSAREHLAESKCSVNCERTGANATRLCCKAFDSSAGLNKTLTRLQDGTETKGRRQTTKLGRDCRASGHESQDKGNEEDNKQGRRRTGGPCTRKDGPEAWPR